MYQFINLVTTDGIVCFVPVIYQIPCDSAIKSTAMPTDTLLVEFVVISWKIKGQSDLRNVIIQMRNKGGAVDQDM